MKKLKTMSYRELYNKFKIILNLKYINNIITDPEALKDFYDHFTNIENIMKLEDYLKAFFKKYEKLINNEAYVFYTLKTIREEGKDPRFLEVEKNCIEALKNSDYAHFEINKNSKWQGDEVVLVTAKELIGQTIENKSEEERRIEKISEQIDCASLFGINSNSEIESIYGKSASLNRYITKICMIDALGEVIPLSVKEKNEIFADSSDKKLKKLINGNKDIPHCKVDMIKFCKRIAEYVKKYPDFFDLDSIFLIAAFRTNYYLEHNKLTEEENINMAKKLKILKENIKSHKAKVSNLIVDDGMKKMNNSYSYSALEAACKRITPNGKYISSAEEMLIMDVLEIDPGSILDMDPDTFSVVRLPLTQLMEMSKDEGVFSYLVQNDLLSNNVISRVIKQGNICERDIINLIKDDNLSKEQIDEYIKVEEHISSELFSVLDEKEFFTADEKLEYYINGNLEIDALSNMSGEKKDEIAQLLSPEELMSLYKDENKKKEYSRYAIIFRNFVLAGKKKEEKTDIGERMVAALDDTLSDEDLIKLYQEHLISLNTVDEWSGSQVIIDMMKNAMIRPSDVKEICTDGNYDSIIDIMKDPSIPRKNKMAIFYTTFADEDDSLSQEQIELREMAKKECLGYMNFADKQEKRSSNRNGTHGVSNDDVKKANEYVSDPLDRWTLFKLLDSEYSYEILDQGMMIFKCPNLNNGVVFLEKMFKKDEPDYARATKVLSIPIEDFERIKKDLISNGDIPPYKVESHPALNGHVDSIWHSTAWGQRMADLCGYKIDNRRSKENIDAIDRAIDRIKKSRTLRK